MNRPLHTTIRTSHQTITIAYAGGLDERYSLFRFRDGDVGWRLDQFRFPEDARETASWAESHGRLTVGEVVDRLPGHADLVREWTRKEISLGTVIADDIFSAMTRERALARLGLELEATEAGSRQAA